VSYTIRMRRDSTANWESLNPILEDGEFGLEKDTNQLKIGDGLTPWNYLEYLILSGETPPGGGDSGTDARHRGPWQAYPTEHIDFESGVIDERLIPDADGWTVVPSTVTGTRYGQALDSRYPGSPGDSHIDLVQETVSGDITFYREISSESFDKMRFYVDGVKVLEETGNVAPWAKKTIPVSAGSHVFRWEQHFDATGFGGYNGFRITDINWPSAPGENGYLVGDVVTYNGFEWRCNILNTGELPGVGFAWTKVSTNSVKTINNQTGTAYTLVLSDEGTWIRLNNAAAIALTVPPNSAAAFPIGTQIEGNQAGAGQVTIVAGSGVTINATPGLKVAARYGVFGLMKVDTDVWVAYGRLSA
jgi:hypothetical protein